LLLAAIHGSRAAAQVELPAADRDAPGVVSADRANRWQQRPLSARRIQIFPRGSTGVDAQWFPGPGPNEQIVVINSGVFVIVDGLDTLGKIDISTDRIVMWTTGLDRLDFSSEAFQHRDVPLEVYLEGNIVFRQADRVIYAQRMYYNVKDEIGVVLDGEMLTPVPDYDGVLRLKADVLQQLDRHHFQAMGGSITSSRLGVPRYWLQSEHIAFQDVQQPIVNPFTGQSEIDAATGDVAVHHQLLATSNNNFLFAGGLPLLYWPVLATDLTEPNYYVDSLRIRNDNVFGTQALFDFHVHQLLGWRRPPAGTQWIASLDPLSKRGIGVGTTLSYNGNDLFGHVGPYHGVIDAWGIKDDGVDHLGLDRRSLVPEKPWRGRFRAQHRHELPGGFQFTAEAALISDRNFLEQYFENEWDQLKDQTTGLELKRIQDNSSWSITADYRLNDFFTQTNNLPRLDHFLLGHSVLGDRLTWYAHSNVGYSQLKTASLSTDPADPSNFLPWELDGGSVAYDKREGLNAATRQEIDLPVQLGAVKVVPYALGELAYWQEDIDATEVTRAYGQAGIRASMPIWRANSNVQNALWNLSGLAHKVVFDAEFFWADANRDLDRLPLYNPLNDDALEAFQRRFFIPTGSLAAMPLALRPPIDDRFDDRYFALRTGMQGHVAAPVTEIADDLMVARMGARQRWQTKRGLPGQERIIDWIVLDVNASFFPEPERDNFGADVGLIDYDFRWHVGDRVTLLSDGFLDVFGDGLRMMTVGGIINRPERGSFYVGFRSLEGPISSNVLSASVSYRMSEKWVAGLGTAVDFGETGNIGQTLRFTRIGESMLVSIGMIVDESRNNIGLHLAIEPRFLPRARLGRVGGVSIPPAGAFGLE